MLVKECMKRTEESLIKTECASAELPLDMNKAYTTLRRSRDSLTQDHSEFKLNRFEMIRIADCSRCKFHCHFTGCEIEINACQQPSFPTLLPLLNILVRLIVGVGGFDNEDSLKVGKSGLA